MDTGVGFIDGTYVPLGELRIPVTDLGFMMSDLCYDAVHVRDGRFFRLGDHMDRFERGIRARRYETLGHDRDSIGTVLHECVRRAGLRDAMVYAVATRGEPPADGQKDLRQCRNRLMAWARPYYGVVSEVEMEWGCDIVVAETVRIPPASVDPTVKNFGRLDFVAALFEAYDRDAAYAVLPDTDGNVTEGRGWNIFVLTGGRLRSPDSGVLEGITRRTVMEIAGRLNIEARFDRVPVADLHAADEVFITSTAGGIMPVRSVDGRTVGDGAPGPVTRRVATLYDEMHRDPAHTTPVRYAAG